MKNYQDFCHSITKKLFAIIDEKGSLLTWHKSWAVDGCGKLPIGSKGLYRNSNLFGLLTEQVGQGYNSNRWLTFNQIKKTGGHVKKGAKSEVVCFWQMKTMVDETSTEKSTKTVPLFKTYRVFNLEQTTLEPTACPGSELQIHSVDELINKLNVTVSHFGGKAYYRASDDAIVMPKPSQFNSKENYYATLLHELCHFTGSYNREPRECFDKYANDDTARAEEELIAEIGSVFLSAHLGIKGQLENHASYIKSWKQNLSEKQIMSATNKAAKVFEWIINQGGEVKDSV